MQQKFLYSYLLVNMCASGWEGDKTTWLTPDDASVSWGSNLYISGWDSVSVSAGVRMISYFFLFQFYNKIYNMINNVIYDHKFLLILFQKNWFLHAYIAHI